MGFDDGMVRCGMVRCAIPMADVLISQRWSFEDSEGAFAGEWGSAWVCTVGLREKNVSM